MADDPDSDLVLLWIVGTGFHVLPLAEALPDPGAKPLAVTKVGTAATTYLGPGIDPDLGNVILFDAGKLGPGTSGGALLDGKGRFVGVILGGTDDPGEAVAAPVERVRALLARARQKPREL